MAGSITDIFAALQNGVVALSNLGRQTTGSLNNIAAQLATKAASSTVTPSSAIVTTIAGNSGAFTLNGPSGLTNTVNDIKLSAASSSQFGAAKVDGATITAAAGVISTVNPLPTPITNSTSADVALNNTANYFDGPSIAQGTAGTWFVSGTVTLVDTTFAGAATFCKLWDGTTVIDSAAINPPGANFFASVTLSGVITSPASNLRISCRDASATTGKIIFNNSGNSKDSTITAFRIG